MQARGSGISAALLGLTLLVAGCGADLPQSVIEGSSVTVAWSESLTSLNAATTEGGTPGNREIAAATHDSFARIVRGDVETDESFGSVEIVDSAADSFTVRYDLAERTWSDEIPLDAADLVLAWAAGSNATAGDFDSVPGELRHSVDVPDVDESARRIDVLFSRPVRHWHTALDVDVPAHVVGRLALDIEDPMEAKLAVTNAILDDDDEALADIAEAWSSGFDLSEFDGAPPEDLAVASGPYVVTDLEAGDSGAAGVTLEVNPTYEGGSPPSYERIDVTASDDPLADFPDDVDVLQVSPTSQNFLTARDLGRRDHHVSETHAGRLWVLALRADNGLFASLGARRAFLRAVDPTEVRNGGSGPWSGAFAATQSLLFSPETDGYEIAIEDAGYRAAFESATADAAVERARAGVAAGTQVCTAYDSGDPFAAGAFKGLVRSLAETGWRVTDCGRPGVDGFKDLGQGWQAVLTTVPLPHTSDDISAVWGGRKASPLTGLRSKPRQALLRRLERTADKYDARMTQVAVEAGLIEEAVALPLTLAAVVTVTNRDMAPVFPDSGTATTLLGSAGDWGPERGVG